MAKTALLAKLAFIFGLIGAAALPVGALGHRLGLWDHFMGFALVFSGAVLAVLALVLGLPRSYSRSPGTVRQTGNRPWWEWWQAY